MVVVWEERAHRHHRHSCYCYCCSHSHWMMMMMMQSCVVYVHLDDDDGVVVLMAFFACCSDVWMLLMKRYVVVVRQRYACWWIVIKGKCKSKLANHQDDQLLYRPRTRIITYDYANRCFCFIWWVAWETRYTGCPITMSFTFVSDDIHVPQICGSSRLSDHAISPPLVATTTKNPSLIASCVTIRLPLCIFLSFSTTTTTTRFFLSDNKMAGPFISLHPFLHHHFICKW